MPGHSPTSDVPDDSVTLPPLVGMPACPKKDEKAEKKAEPNPTFKIIDDFFQNLTEKNKEFAIKLHKAAYVYAVYGALDGLSLSYSMVKYLFDLQYTSSAMSADVMHDWMLTKEGMFAVGVETVTLIAFSLLANIFKDDDKNVFKRHIAAVWPYCRDSMKGLKNAYKGIRSTLFVLGNSQLGGHDLSNMVVPVGIALGLISAANRICMRKYVYEPRKAMMKENTNALEAIKAIKFFDGVASDYSTYNRAMVENFDPELFRKGYEYCLNPPDGPIEKNKLYFKFLEIGLEYTVIDPLGKQVTAVIDNDKLKEMGCKLKAPLTIAQLKPHLAAIIELTSKEKHTYRTLGIQCQSGKLQSAAMLGAAYGGVVDGLYLFMGAMSIGVIPALFIPMAVLSVIFTVTCIATRIYEEWDFQRKLLETQAKIELALCGKEIEVLFGQMQLLTLPPDTASATDEVLTPEALKVKQEQFLASLKTKMKDFDARMKYLRSQMNLSQTSAALAGLRNGLAAYNAIASFMFAVVTVTMLLSASLPPVFILACAIAGMVCLIGFMSYSLYFNNKHLKAQKPLSADSDNLDKINDLVKSIKENTRTVRELKPTDVEGAILEDGRYDSSPQFWFQEWFEVLRSFFSGLSKGQKSIDYTFNPLQEVDISTGHYHESRIMLWFTAVLGVVYAVSLALRADARGFGRPDITAISQPILPPLSPPSPSSSTAPSAGALEGAGVGFTAQPVQLGLNEGAPTAFASPGDATLASRRAPLEAMHSDDGVFEEGVTTRATDPDVSATGVGGATGDGRTRSMSDSSTGSGVGLGRSRDAFLAASPATVTSAARRSQSTVPQATVAAFIGRGLIARAASEGTLGAGERTLPPPEAPHTLRAASLRTLDTATQAGGIALGSA